MVGGLRPLIFEFKIPIIGVGVADTILDLSL